jgi:photosynthetic reaction center cytochrome c subunit
VKRFVFICAVVVFGGSLGASAGQAPQPPAGAQPQWAPIKNLQVLPADTSRQDLLNTMKGFTAALGVRCTFCHVGEETQPIQTYDFATDTKLGKQTARVMMRMMADANTKLSTVGDKPASEPRVSCYTCHRGQKTPLLKAPAAAGG